MSSTVAAILQRAVDGERLTFDEGVTLLRSADLPALGLAADAVCRRLHPEPYPHLQHRPQHQLHERLRRGLRLLRVLPQDRATPTPTSCRARCCCKKIEETVALGGDQILMQGGTASRRCKLEWYEELLRDIKAHFPQVNLHGFSPPEI